MNDNKLIAEFMGFTNDETIGWYDNEETYLMISSRFENSNCFNEDELNFDKSWDWLMPVVARCMGMGFKHSDNLTTLHYVELKAKHKDFKKHLIKDVMASDRNSAYMRIIRFIETWNNA